MRGWGVYLKAVTACLPYAAATCLHLDPPRRQALQERFLAVALAGLNRRQLEVSVQIYVDQHLPRLLHPEMLQRLREHCQRGDTVVLVSASPTLYLDIWARKEGLAQVMATDLGFDAQGRHTGLKSLNCWGEEKIRRLQDWLCQPKVQLDMAYGESQGDEAMLACAHRPWLRGSHAKMPILH